MAIEFYDFNLIYWRHSGVVFFWKPEEGKGEVIYSNHPIRDSWDSGKSASYLAEVMDVRVMKYMEEHQLSWRD